MGTQKEPIDVRRLLYIEATAEKEPFGKESDDYKIFMLLRYTGAHESVIINPKCNLHEENDAKDRPVVVWLRPKKKGPWARCEILKHRNIQFNINTFVEQIAKRKRKNTRQYIYRRIRDLCDAAGIPNAAPQSLRHSLAIELLNAGWPEVWVCQLLNISRRTLKWYGRYVNEDIKDKLQKMGW